MAQTIGELVVKISADLSDLLSGTKKSEDAVKSFTKNAISALATLGASMKGMQLITQGIEFNKMAEQAKVSFTVMLGSATKATAMLKELRDLSTKTPLEFKDVRESAQVLLQFGVAGDKVVDTIRMLGDVAGGNQEKLQRLSLAFGQVTAKGRLMGDDLRQMIEAGFNPLKEISDKTGVSVKDLTKQMEQGAISSDMVAESFKRVTSEGGMFFGMMEKQSQTLAGKMSTMNDAWETFLGGMTEALTGPIKGVVTALTFMLDAFNALPGPIKAVAGTFTILAGAVGGLILLSKQLGISLSSAFGPIGLAVATVAALAAGIAGIAESAAKSQATAEANARQVLQLTKATAIEQGAMAKAYGETLKNTRWLSNEVIQSSRGFSNLANTLDKTAAKYGITRDQLIDVLSITQKLTPEQRKVVDALESEAGLRERLANAEKALSQGLNDITGRTAALAEQEKARNDAAIKAAEDRKNAQIAAWAEEDAAAIEAFGFISDEEDRIADDRDKRNQDALDANQSFLNSLKNQTIENSKITSETVKADWKSAWDEMVKGVETSAEATKTLFKSLENTVRGTFKSMSQSIGDSLSKGEDGWTSFKKIALNAIGAVLDAVGDYLTTMAVAYLVSEAYASAVLAAAGAVIAYAAGAAVKSEASKLWTGTANPLTQAGMYTVGDQGPETVILPKGASVMNNQDSRDAFGGGQTATGPVVFSFQFDKREFAQAMVDEISNGRTYGLKVQPV